MEPGLGNAWKPWAALEEEASSAFSIGRLTAGVVHRVLRNHGCHSSEGYFGQGTL